MPQFVGVLIAIAVVCFVIWKATTDFSAWYSAGGAYYVWLIVGIIAAIVAAPFVALNIYDKIRWSRIYAKMPKDGPMKVNVTVQEIPARVQFSRFTGSRTAYRLHVDVLMSRKDFAALDRTGMGGRELFDYPNPKYPDVRMSYTANRLWNLPYVDFPDTYQVNIAKTALVESLRALRTHLDATKETPQIQARERPTSESHEI